MDTNLKITLAQINPIVGDLDYNKSKIFEYWEKAGDTDLIVFPELVLCGYPPEDLVLKPFFLDQVENTIGNIIEESKSRKSAILLTTPYRMPEPKGKTHEDIPNEEHVHNAILLIHQGEVKARIFKHHLANYGVFDEKRTFVAGPVPKPVEFKGIKLGLMICEDFWHKDIEVQLKNQGADLYILPNGSPFTTDKYHMRISHAKTRIQEMNIPLIYVNQVGGQDELVFDGGSFVVNENAEIIKQMPFFEESLQHVSYPFTPSTVETNNHETEEIYNALVLGLRDYITKNNFPGVLLGLSGGIDSALSAVIAVDALGADKVHCVTMPSQYTSQDSLDDAEELANTLSIKLDSISIEAPVNAFNEILAPHFDKDAPATTFENIQPRSRGLILMALSNATGNMVLSTGNKSEVAVGYATLYGDMCGGFNALKDVYKTQVYALSRWRNRNGEVIPDRIITKAPTAELKDNQTDQDTLPEYKDLDDILACMIEHDMSVDRIIERGHTRETVERVWKMLDRAEYKRRQAAPGIKITSRSFGRDRRYPITNHFWNITQNGD